MCKRFRERKLYKNTQHYHYKIISKCNMNEDKKTTTWENYPILSVQKCIVIVCLHFLPEF